MSCFILKGKVIFSSCVCDPEALIPSKELKVIKSSRSLLSCVCCEAPASPCAFQIHLTRVHILEPGVHRRDNDKVSEIWKGTAVMCISGKGLRLCFHVCLGPGRVLMLKGWNIDMFKLCVNSVNIPQTAHDSTCTLTYQMWLHYWNASECIKVEILTSVHAIPNLSWLFSYVQLKRSFLILFNNA